MVNGSYYLVNTKGKLQKSESKKYDVEMKDGSTYEDRQFSYAQKKAYKLSPTAWVKDNAAIPYIVIYDSWVIEDPTSYADVVVPVGPESRPEFVDANVAKNIINLKESDEGDEEGWE